MKLLVVDTDPNTELIINFLVKKEPNWEFIYKSDSNEALETYNSTEIDFVIIDFSKNDYFKLLEKIVDKNPLQKTITISKEILESELSGCNHCKENLNRKRLMKPLDTSELYDLIKNFKQTSCKFYNNFDNIETILKDILKQFIFFTLDEEKMMIVRKRDYFTKIDFEELLKITKILSEKNLKYEITSESDIKLL